MTLALDKGDSGHAGSSGATAQQAGAHGHGRAEKAVRPAARGPLGEGDLGAQAGVGTST